MGLLDGIVGSALGSVLGGNQSMQSSNPLGALVNGLGAESATRGGDMLGAVMTLVQQNGGLTGVLDMLRGSGLAHQADSWVGTGANANISPAQVEQVFGGSGLNHVASQLGTSHGEASSILSQILPELVNQLTPQGQVPDNHGDLLSQGLAMLRGQQTR